MRKGFDALSTEEKIRLVQEIRQKKIGLLDKDWITLCEEYELDMSAETLRKAGVGVQMAEEAGMLSSSSYQEAIAGKYDADKIERQKIRDVGNKLNALTRSEARSQLLRETVYTAIRQVAKENPIKFHPAIYRCFALKNTRSLWSALVISTTARTSIYRACMGRP